MSKNDRLDEGFELLRACSREQAPFDLDLEDRMMKEFTNANRNWILCFSKMAAAVLICVAVAGAAVAATGGFSRILKNFTGTVEVINGDSYELKDGKVIDGEGNVIGTAEVEIATD